MGLEEQTVDLEKSTARVQELKAQVSELDAQILEHKRRKGELYAEMGRELLNVRQHLVHGQWIEWLDAIGISRGIAHKYITIAKDPSTWERSGYDLAKVTVNVSALRHRPKNGRDAVQEVITRAHKLREALKWITREDSEDQELSREIDDLIGELQRLRGLCPRCRAPKMEDYNNHQACPVCGLSDEELIQKELEDYQQRIELEEKWDYLSSHPAYPWSQVLIIQHGKNTGEVRDNVWTYEHYGKTHDEISQELGYERSEVPDIGHAPTYDMVSDERFRHDLRECDRMAKELKLKAETLGPKLKPMKVSDKLPPKRSVIGLPRLNVKKAKAISEKASLSLRTYFRFYTQELCKDCKWYIESRCKFGLLHTRNGCLFFGERPPN